MKRWILFFVLFALIVLGSFTSYLYLYRAEFIANSLSKTLGVPVKIKAVDISSNGLVIQKLTISNPRGCAIPKAFSASRLKIDANMTDLFLSGIGLSSKEIVIPQIVVDSPIISLEVLSLLGRESNWSALVSHIPKMTPSQSDHSRRYRIDKLVLNQVELSVKNPFSDQILRSPTIQQIAVENIGNGQPLTFEECAQAVITTVLVQAESAAGMPGATEEREDLSSDSKKPAESEWNEKVEQAKGKLKELLK